MTRWEYMLVVCTDNRVVFINGKEAGTLSRHSVKPQAQSVFKFLPQAGLDGWEAINLAIVHGEYYNILFKRPIEEQK